ncbi:hypothetical protein [Planomonospora algeriensis]
MTTPTTQTARYFVTIALEGAPTLDDVDGDDFVPDELTIEWEWCRTEWQRTLAVAGCFLRRNGAIGRRGGERYETPEYSLPAWFQEQAEKVPAPPALPFPS